MIAHFDLDAFYASVAELDDPTLCGKPLAVAGSGRRAVVLTASYAARPFGVRSAMPLWQAKERCPELVVVAPDFERYRELSRRTFVIFHEGARAVEGLSLDEAFVDLGAMPFAAAAAHAHLVRERIFRETGLTASAGIATVKIAAKIASDACKPNGLAGVEPGREAEFLAPFPVGRLWGVGPKTQTRLSAGGIVTIGDLAEIDDERLFQLLGRGGRFFRELARGRDDRTVEPERETRSISVEETFEFDVTGQAQLRQVLRAQADEVAAKLVRHGLTAATVGVKVKRADFSVIGRQTSLAQPADDARILYAAAKVCLQKCALAGAAIRLIGLRAAGLRAPVVRQTALF